MNNGQMARVIVVWQWLGRLLALRALLERGARGLLVRDAGQGVIEWLVIMAIAVAIGFAAVKVLGPAVGAKVGDITACLAQAGRGTNGVGTCTLG